MFNWSTARLIGVRMLLVALIAGFSGVVSAPQQVHAESTYVAFMYPTIPDEQEGELIVGYTLDTTDQVWKNGDTLTVTLPDTFPSWSAFASSTSVTVDKVTPDEFVEYPLEPGTTAGTYTINGRLLVIHFDVTTWGDGTPAELLSGYELRVVAGFGNTAVPINVNNQITVQTHASGGAAPLASAYLRVMVLGNLLPSDAQASLVLTTNATVGGTGSATLTATTPQDLQSGSTVAFDVPHNLAISPLVTTTSSNFSGCSMLTQSVICRVSSTIPAGIFTLPISGITATHAATGQQIRNIIIADQTGVAIAMGESGAVTDTAIGTPGEPAPSDTGPVLTPTPTSTSTDVPPVVTPTSTPEIAPTSTEPVLDVPPPVTTTSTTSTPVDVVVVVAPTSTPTSTPSDASSSPQPPQVSQSTGGGGGVTVYSGSGVTNPLSVLPPAAVSATPVVSPGVSSVLHSSGFSAFAAQSAEQTIDSQFGLHPASVDPLCMSGSLIKTQSASSVYYCGADGKRYVFPTLSVYESWYTGFLDVTTISESDMARIPLGGNVRYRAGTALVKLQTDPRVYVIAPGGVLRWITDEKTARALYGSDWNHIVTDISDAFFMNYSVGDSISL